MRIIPSSNNEKEEEGSKVTKIVTGSCLNFSSASMEAGTQGKGEEERGRRGEKFHPPPRQGKKGGRKKYPQDSKLYVVERRPIGE